MIFPFDQCYFPSYYFAINDQGGTDVSLDNQNLFINDYMIFGIGKFDSALGSFIQNLSPSWVNRLPDSPVGFSSDLGGRI